MLRPSRWRIDERFRSGLTRTVLLGSLVSRPSGSAYELGALDRRELTSVDKRYVVRGPLGGDHNVGSNSSLDTGWALAWGRGVAHTCTLDGCPWSREEVDRGLPHTDRRDASEQKRAPLELQVALISGRAAIRIRRRPRRAQRRPPQANRGVAQH